MKRNHVFSIVIAVFVLLNLLGIIWVINRVMQNTSNIKNQIVERRPLPPEFQYSVLNENGLMKKWVVNDVFADFVLFQSDLAVGDKKLFLLGSLHHDDPRSIIVLDSSNGGFIWKSDPIDTGSNFAIDNNNLYIAQNSTGKINKVHLENFQAEWEVSLRPLHSPCCLQIIDDNLQGSWEPNQFYVLSTKDGSSITKLKNQGSPIFRLEENIIYYRGGTNVLGAADEKGDYIWAVGIDEEFWQAPVFDEEVIFVRSGTGIGRIYAVNRRNGDILWKSPGNVISSLAQSEEHLYYFTEQGVLVGVDKDSGEKNFSVEFTKNSNIPSNLDGRNNYEVVYDESNSLVYLWMGDSAQLFAFQVENGK